MGDVVQFPPMRTCMVCLHLDRKSWCTAWETTVADAGAPTECDLFDRYEDD